MKTARDVLPHYFSILKGDERAGYLDACIGKRALKAHKILEDCHFCERRCGVDRTRGERGYCGVGKAGIASRFLHHGEEPELVPSFTVFFSGCTMKCLYCQNWDISQNPKSGVYVEPEQLAGEISTIGARNVNWVGGDPTPNLYYILQVLAICERSIPQIWNSNMYCSREAMELLDGVMDVYLTDFKYGNDTCAKRLSDAPNYLEIVKRNHLLAYKQGDVLVRHLVLPNHFECCTKPILRWLSENLPNARINIMDQYRPEWRAHEVQELMHKPLQEYRDAVKLGTELELNLV